ncbi:MAG: MazE family transcriptional regulator [Gammaproteobacteria bacterium RBG_16_51_14]|nr:MAG: MazE family transcriptional regulator [Gammaproteobacteria bacterium RBG_16_51_14]
MKANIVRIGNSKGIRLPKSVLEQCHLQDSVELAVEGNTLIIRPVHAPRSGWAEAFSTMARQGDDGFLDADAGLSTEWDKSEWRW